MLDKSLKYYQENIELFSKVNEVAVAFNNSNPANRIMSAIDFRDKEILKFFHDLEEQQVMFLLVGGFAMAFHGYVRATHDLDLWIKDDPQNIEQLKRVLALNGVKGLENAKNLQLIAGFTEFKVGDSGFIIDPMTNLKAFSSFDFDQCYERATSGDFNGVHFKVIQAKDLLKEKESTNRPKDQGDIDYLRKIILRNIC